MKKYVLAALLAASTLATGISGPAAGQQARYTTDPGREAATAGAIGGLLLMRQWVLDEPSVGPQSFDRTWAGSSFDESATRYSSEAWRAWTDRMLVGIWASALATAVLPASQGDGERWWRLVSLAEAGLLTLGTTQILKLAVGRHRPYTYNASLSDERIAYLVGTDSADARASFPSGHASLAFAGATFSASMLTTTQDWPTYGDAAIWALTMAAATSVAIGRVRAGKHFSTDVIVGAVLGTALGLLAPACHEIGEGLCNLKSAESGPALFDISLLSVPVR